MTDIDDWPGVERLPGSDTQASQEWLVGDREPDLLFRSARLAHAQEWAASHAEDMNPLERDFLCSSIASSEKEAAEREAQRQGELAAAQKLADMERRRAEEGDQDARRLQRRSISISIVGALAAILAIFAFLAWQNSAKQAAHNHSLNLAAAALRTYESGQVDLALILAKESVRLDAQSTEAIRALRTVGLGFGTRFVLSGHSYEVKTTALSPDAKIAFSGSCAQVNENGACTASELNIMGPGGR